MYHHRFIAVFIFISCLQNNANPEDGPLKRSKTVLCISSLGKRTSPKEKSSLTKTKSLCDLSALQAEEKRLLMVAFLEKRKNETPSTKKTVPNRAYNGGYCPAFNHSYYNYSLNSPLTPSTPSSPDHEIWYWPHS